MDESKLRRVVRGVIVHTMMNNSYSREDIDKMLYAIDNAWELTVEEAEAIHYQMIEGKIDFTKAESRSDRIRNLYEIRETVE